MDLFRRQIEIFGEDVEDVLVDYESEFIGNNVEFVLRFEQLLDRLDTDKALVSCGIDAFGV